MIVRDALHRGPRSPARKQAADWYDQHKWELLAMTAAELEAFADAAAKGNRIASEVLLMAGAPRAVWVAYRNGVTRRIAALAHRRARAALAVRRLSLIGLRMLGLAISRGL